MVTITDSVIRRRNGKSIKGADGITDLQSRDAEIWYRQAGIASGASLYLAQLVKDVMLPKDESKITASDVAETSKLTNKASLDIINDIGSNPYKAVAGKFAGQGIENGVSCGDVSLE
ncbi:hypothetical protein H2Y54_03130 [Pectobacterium aroidearum]|uniref:hypothetical protein n=1 Tax=Pectobacterium aroidearum TaxID=1201031 RepID=UPI0015F05FAE|nr:hypothetical protein [Pectobacterium aroidearum]MBA5235548.1 hypothetical protein [Pectobacterium aroidearum]